MSPVPKKSRHDQSDDSVKGSDDGGLSGFIRFEIADISDITPAGIFSHVKEVLGLPWSLKVAKVDDFLGVFLYHRKSDSDMWSIEVEFEISLITIGEGTNHFRKLKQTFNNDHSDWGFDKFIEWKDLIDEGKGFIKEDKITIEARFSVAKTIGIRKNSRLDFTDPNEPRHDFSFVINGEKIYVNKGILAIHSPVLSKGMFSAEKNKKEMELKDVDREEFVRMLNFIYPSYEKITDANVESLLKLADRFQIKKIVDPVEQFLINSTTFNTPSKLRLSDQHRLVRLQDHCIDSLKTMKDITDLEKVDGYKDLSKDIKALLLTKVMKLTNG